MITEDKIYSELLKHVSEITGIEKEVLFSCKKEEFVNAKSLLVHKCIEAGLSESYLTHKTGMKQQSINRLKNKFKDRLNAYKILTINLHEIDYMLSTKDFPNNLLY